ncbi:extracellular solute-binding protein [Pseudomonas sp. ADPe]|nr:extracellular solute-binding protein [Pseudomonas sp. ADPe]RFQ18393.1 extracellular solute-binding protein [Pseudomonas sp. ATCC 13867]
MLLIASNSVAADAVRTVNVYAWASYLAPETLARFEKQTGIKVKYDSFDSADVLEAKLMTGHTGYDVVQPGVAMLDRLIRAKALQPSGMQQYKTKEQYDPQLLAQLEKVDPGNLYAVPYAWGTTGLAYNKDAIEKRIPNAPLNSFDLLFKPEYTSKLKDCGIAIIDSPQEVMSIALHYLGKNPYSQNSADYIAAKQLLDKLRPNLRYIAFGKQSNDLANGDLCLALSYNGDAMTAKGQAVAANKPFAIGYQIPKEGTLAWIDNFAIPADAPHVEEAKEFIEFVTEAEGMAEMTNTLYYANANRASLDKVNPVLRNDETLFPSAESRKTLFGEEPLPARTLRERTRTWASFRTNVGN